MRAEIKGARLSGFLNPVDAVPGFVFPVFQQSGGNEFLVQEISMSEAVLAFKTIDCDAIPVTHVPDGKTVAVGDDALWAFAYSKNEVVCGTRGYIRYTLSERRGEFSNSPMLTLQVLKWMAEEDQLPSAMASAYSYLLKLSPNAAENWRDHTEVPELVRRSLHRISKEKNIGLTSSDLRELVVARSKGELSIGGTQRLIKATMQPDVRSSIEKEISSYVSLLGLPDVVVRASLRAKKAPAKWRRKALDEAVDELEERGLRLLAESKNYLAARNFRLAEDFVLKAKGCFERGDFEDLFIEAEVCAGEIQLQKGDWQTAELIFLGLRGKLQGKGDDAKIALLELKLAKLALATSKLADLEQRVTADIVPALIKTKQFKEVAEAHQIVSDLQRDLGDFHAASFTILTRVLPIYLAIGDAEGEMLTLGNLASLLFRQGDVETAQKFLSKEFDRPEFARLGKALLGMAED